MSDKLKITILGCGSSSGVPMIGCECEVCTSDNPKNRRLRASIWLQKGDTSIIIDSSPDLRQQALANGIKRIDALVYTHEHADHTHGIDDLRGFNYIMDSPIPTYLNQYTLDKLKERFAYAFLPKPEPVWYRPCLVPHMIDDETWQPFTIGDITLQPFRQIHGQGETIGFRIDDFVYSTDVNIIPEESKKYLENIDTWLVDCLRYHEAPTHAYLPVSLAWIREFKPKHAILTHMSHNIEYETLRNELPEGVEPAYDGMVIEGGS